MTERAEGKRIEIHVQLLDEGTLVWRPALAIEVRPGVARLLSPEDFDPELERWEFPPGSIVRFERRQMSEGWANVAIQALDAGWRGRLEVLAGAEHDRLVPQARAEYARAVGTLLAALR